MGKVGAWLGLTANHTEIGTAGKVPMWFGVPGAAKLIWGAVWAAVAAAVFLLANQRMTGSGVSSPCISPSLFSSLA